jgi:hypothetical protein
MISMLLLLLLLMHARTVFLLLIALRAKLTRLEHKL